jgi:precorrin-3B synthase
MSLRAAALDSKEPAPRGACPGLSDPMPTGDGLLARLLPIGTIPLPAWVGLCAAARSHGNGIVEITARGSIQIRGLNTTSAPTFATAVAGLAIAAHDGIPVLSDPLAGLDAGELLDAAALAASLRSALSRETWAARHGPAARLGPKVSVVIDGGGALALDDIIADVRLGAETVHGVAQLRVSVGGNGSSASDLGSVPASRAVETVLRILKIIAQRGREARARHIVRAEGAAVFGTAIADLVSGDVPSPAPRQIRNRIGTHPLRNGTLACGVGFAFGHAEAATLEQLAACAGAAGATGVRAAPGRTLMIVGLTAATATAFIVDAEQLGFIVSAEDPRGHIIACAGAPICASAHIAARALGPRVAKAAAQCAGAAFKIHISGCAKGCAHHAAAALTVVGTPAGCALIANGTTRDVPFAFAAADDLPAAIATHAAALKHEGGHG